MIAFLFPRYSFTYLFANSFSSKYFLIVLFDHLFILLIFFVRMFQFFSFFLEERIKKQIWFHWMSNCFIHLITYLFIWYFSNYLFIIVIFHYHYFKHLLVYQIICCFCKERKFAIFTLVEINSNFSFIFFIFINYVYLQHCNKSLLHITQWYFVTIN